VPNNPVERRKNYCKVSENDEFYAIGRQRRAAEQEVLKPQQHAGAMGNLSGPPFSHSDVNRIEQLSVHGGGVCTDWVGYRVLESIPSKKPHGCRHYESEVDSERLISVPARSYWALLLCQGKNFSSESIPISM
jgi:hypothetical protein